MKTLFYFISLLFNRKKYSTINPENIIPPDEPEIEEFRKRHAE